MNSAYLLASSGEQLDRLVAQSIAGKPRSRESLKPMAISRVPSPRELRSLQKAAILRRHFEELELETPIVAVYTPQSKGAPKLEGDSVWS